MTAVELKSGAIVIAAQSAPAALAAVAAVCGVEADQAVAALRGLGFEATGLDESMDRLVIDGFRGHVQGPADAALAALAPFVDEETILLWEDDNGTRWRYLIAGGKIVEQVPEELWRNAADRSLRTGGVLAPLTITRDEAGFAQWWEQTPNREDIIDTLQSLASTDDCVDVEYHLQSLMTAIFQESVDAARWLHVKGLRRDAAVGYVCLDIDRTYDCDGVLDGVEVVLSLQTRVPLQWLRTAVYLDYARKVLVPEAVDDPQAALAQILDTALDIVNTEIAERDRFVFEARDVLAC